MEPSTALTDKLVARARIQALLKYLQEMGGRWSIAKWTSRVYEWVVQRAGLMLSDIVEQSKSRANDFVPRQEPQQQMSVNEIPLPRIDDLPFDPNTGLNADEDSFDVGEILPDLWMQDFVGESFFGQLDDGIFGFPQL